MSVNKVTIIGNLGRDPEVRTFQNGNKVANIRVATSESWKDKQTGERRERVEWHSVAIFAEHAVRYAEQYLRKGSKVYVEGKLETRKWQDQTGQDRYSTEIVVRPYGGEVQGLDKPPSRDGQGDQGQGGGGGYTGGYDDQGARQGGAGQGQGSGQSGGGYSGGPGGYQDDRGGPPPGDMDDEIPF